MCNNCLPKYAPSDNELDAVYEDVMELIRTKHDLALGAQYLSLKWSEYTGQNDLKAAIKHLLTVRNQAVAMKKKSYETF